MAKLKKQSNAPAQNIKFQKKLVLNRWLLSLFKVDKLEDFAKLKKDGLEDINEENQSKFAVELLNNITFNKEKLFEYDTNIIKHTNSLQRGIKWKYFQYLSLLFTEIYLDRYFDNKNALLNELNFYLKNTFNSTIGNELEEFKLEELNKLAFWNATGSGKTFLMHINIKQFEHYANNYKYKYDKTLLITPNVALSNQHLDELNTSKIEAEIFTKNSGGLDFGSNKIEILEITKLGDKEEVAKVATESFGENNLVFIDEGHRGSSGDVWKTNRDALSKNGFSFEYSATFGQSINGANQTNKKALTNEYAKSILFDYSYKYFYEDGYGKEYFILNLSQNNDVQTDNFTYLVGALLSYYQQLLIFKNEQVALKNYNIHKPLMVWVGSSVNVVQKKHNTESSDVLDVLLFMERFLANSNNETTNAISNILNAQSGLGQTDIFGGKFEYLSGKNVTIDNIKQQVFHTNSQNLELVNIKNANGEIGLKVGGEYFGVINVGDDSKLLSLCKTKGFQSSDDQFSSSLFDTLNNDTSNLTMLIGSKKFTEGWNSWRVSSMGLLNMGQSEGSQIIQLFGRGVRLKGQDMSLKRSTAYGKALPHNLQTIETLNIFGLNADYMATFKTYLENEDVKTNEPIKKTIKTKINTIYQCESKQPPLKTLTIDGTRNFKEENKSITIGVGDFLNVLANKKVTIDLFSKVNIITSTTQSGNVITLNPIGLPKDFLKLIDCDKLYLELLEYKRDKKYFNLNIKQDDVCSIFNNSNWYDIYAPNDYFVLKSYKDVNKIYDVVLMLCKKFLSEYYNHQKRIWEMSCIVCKDLDCNDSNFIKEYTIEIPADNQSYKTSLENLNEVCAELIIHQDNLNIFSAEPHLYCPLIFQSKQITDIKISPVPLNEGENKFVVDLRNYLNTNSQNELCKDGQFYLLRNQSKMGVGFFSESAFYPDFMLWAIKDNKQYLTFIDPKGLRNLNPINDPKIQLSQRIKEIEKKLEDCNLILNSFIVSNTTLEEINRMQVTKVEKSTFNDANVIFQEDENYIQQIINKLEICLNQ